MRKIFTAPIELNVQEDSDEERSPTNGNEIEMSIPLESINDENFLSITKFLTNLGSSLGGVKESVDNLLGVFQRKSDYRFSGGKSSLSQQNQFMTSLIKINTNLQDHLQRIDQEQNILEHEKSVFENTIKGLQQQNLEGSLREASLKRTLRDYRKFHKNSLSSTNIAGLALGTGMYTKRSNSLLGKNDILKDSVLLKQIIHHEKFAKLKKSYSLVVNKEKYSKRKLNELEHVAMERAEEFTKNINKKDALLRELVVSLHEIEKKKRKLGLENNPLLDEKIEAIKGEIEQTETEKVNLQMSYDEFRDKNQVQLSYWRQQAGGYHLELSKLREKLEQLTPRSEYNSPKGGEKYPSPFVVLVFTDVQGSTLMWERDMDVMSECMEMHNSLMRFLIKKHKGYECKTEGDAFMVAFDDIVKAVNYSVDVQLELMTAKWPPEIMKHFEMCKPIINVGENGQKTGNLLWKGLRVRIGMHCGYPIVEKNIVSNRADYHGPVVNKAARVEQSSRGGEVCVSESVHSILADRLDDLDEECVVFFKGQFPFKGMEGTHKVFSVYPKVLENRHAYLEKYGEKKNNKSAITKDVGRKFKKQPSYRTLNSVESKPSGIEVDSDFIKGLQSVQGLFAEQTQFLKRLVSFQMKKIDAILKNPPGTIQNDFSSEKSAAEKAFSGIEGTSTIFKEIFINKRVTFSDVRKDIKEDIAQLKKMNEDFSNEFKVMRKKKIKVKKIKATSRYMEVHHKRKSGGITSKKSGAFPSGSNIQMFDERDRSDNSARGISSRSSSFGGGLHELKDSSSTDNLRGIDNIKPRKKRGSSAQLSRMTFDERFLDNNYEIGGRGGPKREPMLGGYEMETQPNFRGFSRKVDTGRGDRSGGRGDVSRGRGGNSGRRKLETIPLQPKQLNPMESVSPLSPSGSSDDIDEKFWGSELPGERFPDGKGSKLKKISGRRRKKSGKKYRQSRWNELSRPKTSGFKKRGLNSLYDGKIPRNVSKTGIKIHNFSL